MSLLENNKRKEKQNKSEIIPTRVTEDEYKKFQELCKATGYTMSEAIRMLILNEINPTYEKPAPKKTTYTKPNTESIQNVYAENPEKPASAPRPAPKPVSRSNFGRFTTEQWKVDNFLPCPICKTWASFSNFSRHTKSAHGMTTQEIFTEYKDIADQMVAERKLE